MKNNAIAKIRLTVEEELRKSRNEIGVLNREGTDDANFGFIRGRLATLKFILRQLKEMDG